MTQDEKLAAAEKELKNATLDIHEDFEEEWSLSRSVEDFAPEGLAELISWAAECLLGLQWQLEWDFDADVEDMFLSKGTTTYWFRAVDLADIIAENLPVVRSRVSSREVK
jgi:hypothetical protein